jgi:multicomponent Na+:H+ antiporter subunit D
MTAATTGMVAITVALTVFAGPLYDVCTRIGEALLQPVSLTQLQDDVQGSEKAP